MQGIEELIKREVKQVFGNRNFILRDEMIAFDRTFFEQLIKINQDEFIVFYYYEVEDRFSIGNTGFIIIENESNIYSISDRHYINSNVLNHSIVSHTDTSVNIQTGQKVLIKYFRVQIM